MQTGGSGDDAGLPAHIHTLGPHRVRRPALLLPLLQGLIIKSLPQASVVCHGVTLKVGLDSIWQGQLVDAVHVSPGHDAVTAQLVQRKYFVGAPQPFHSIPLESHSRKLLKTLSDVEVDQRGNLNQIEELKFN